MPHDVIPTTEPEQLLAGDSWQWDKYLSDHRPDDGWVLTYYLRRGEDAAIQIDAADATDHHEVRELGSTTQNHPPGLYRLIGRVELTSGDIFTIYDSFVVIEPDPVVATGSFAEQMVTALKAELLALTTAGGASSGTVRSWRQGDREEERASVQEREAVARLLGNWMEQVRQERGQSAIVSVKATFGRPS